MAEWDEGLKELVLYSSTQIPHLLKIQLVVQLNLPENHLRVIAPEVGGGFGSKCNVWAEEALACFAAMDLKRAIKWIETRRESIQVVAHGRGHMKVGGMIAAVGQRLLDMTSKMMTKRFFPALAAEFSSTAAD